MPMLPNVAIISRPAGPAARTQSTAPSTDRRIVELTAEARRLARRRSIAEGVASRSRINDRGLGGEASALIFRRAKRRATRLSLVFHRAIQTLWEAGAFDEALAIFREHKAELARRGSRVARQG
ncbi:hypothetical protein P12x_005801 [Tundrisphaera lichenicola]|uniref:hypothetical protein n=1 Tax=Tundrisphaera lichenicola TaxID=2029860 RepID=UPI003EBD0006